MPKLDKEKVRAELVKVMEDYYSTDLATKLVDTYLDDCGDQIEQLNLRNFDITGVKLKHDPNLGAALSKHLNLPSNFGTALVTALDYALTTLMIQGRSYISERAARRLATIQRNLKTPPDHNLN